MKKKLLMILCVTIMCVGLTACGGEEPETSGTTTGNPVSSEVTTTPAETVAPTAEPVTEEPEVVDEPEDEGIAYEDVIGDVDVDLASLTAADMAHVELGVDIPLENDEGYLTLSDIGLKGLTVLFPSPMYWTAQATNRTDAAKNDGSVSFNISARVVSYEFSTTTAFNEHDYGRYVVYERNANPRAGTEREDTQWLSVEIVVIDTQSNNHLYIALGGAMLTENGSDVMIEYRDAFIADFLAQFEAMSE